MIRERPRQPPIHPPRDVCSGEQTTAEMCIGFLQLTLDVEHRDNQSPAKASSPESGRTIRRRVAWVAEAE